MIVDWVLMMLEAPLRINISSWHPTEDFLTFVYSVFQRDFQGQTRWAFIVLVHAILPGKL